MRDLGVTRSLEMLELAELNPTSNGKDFFFIRTNPPAKDFPGL